MHQILLGGDDIARQNSIFKIPIQTQCKQWFEFKATGGKPPGRLHPFPLPREKFTQISCDFAALPPSYGMDQVLVVVDRATRYLTLVALSKTDGAEDVWTLIENSVFLPFGYPVVIVHDRDPRFISEFWKGTMKAHGILPHFTTAYHPQTDSLSEAFVKKMKEVVHLVSSEDEWVKDLPRIQACINHSWHTSLNSPTSSLLFG